MFLLSPRYDFYLDFIADFEHNITKDGKIQYNRLI